MVIYDLICEHAHVFEGWFKDSDDYQQQKDQQLLSCPVCNTLVVDIKVSAPKVSTSKNSSVLSNQGEFSDEQKRQYREFQQALTKVHDYIETNYQDVGSQFAQEAISIQKGESEQRNIRGTATAKEVKELHAKGVPAMPLPTRPPKKLN